MVSGIFLYHGLRSQVYAIMYFLSDGIHTQRAKTHYTLQ